MYPTLLPLMCTPQLSVVDWTDAPTGRFKWTRPFRRKTKSGFCACVITFQLASTCQHSQYPSHYLRTRCIQHHYRWCRTPRLPVVDWTDAPPADLYGLVRFAERRNLVSARVSSRFKRSLPTKFLVPAACNYSPSLDKWELSVSPYKEILRICVYISNCLHFFTMFWSL